MFPAINTVINGLCLSVFSSSSFISSVLNTLNKDVNPNRDCAENFGKELPEFNPSRCRFPSAHNLRKGVDFQDLLVSNPVSVIGDLPVVLGSSWRCGCPISRTDDSGFFFPGWSFGVGTIFFPGSGSRPDVRFGCPCFCPDCSIFSLFVDLSYCFSRGLGSLVGREAR